MKTLQDSDTLKLPYIAICTTEVRDFAHWDGDNSFSIFSSTDCGGSFGTEMGSVRFDELPVNEYVTNVLSTQKKVASPSICLGYLKLLSLLGRSPKTSMSFGTPS